MYQPNKTFLASLFGLCLLVKILPFVLMHFGMDIQSETTYPWTFTPFFAVGIFGVALFRKMSVGVLVPLAAWVIGDILIGVLSGLKYGMRDGLAYAMYPGQFMNYLGLLLACGSGLLVRRSRNVGTIAVSCVVAPTVFFAISNFGVWAFDTWINYPKTLAGLQTAYLAAIPFYKNALISTVGYSALLFSPLGIAMLKRRSEETSAAVVSTVARQK
ncbi:DUF6580 family putative transport protein [Planctomicrobium sp. SH527]|uniref:DUF6580 family putative transport protein n=1 Tax=Planctomicrobium sp. SH527 TaxID=3448123 RepID=UPI003F5C0A7E